MSAVRSLSRRRADPPGGGFDDAPLFERERARDYLASRMPGKDPIGRAEGELDAMTQRERVFLEIEMATRAESAHSFDYDSSAWSRR